jgi:hypothetical protein
MKPNQDKNRKFNLNKQTVQTLDNSKLAAIKAGNADEAEHTTTVILSVTTAGASTWLCVGICAITI